MKDNYTTTEALMSNLKLIKDCAKELEEHFELDPEKKKVYKKISMTANILLIGVLKGDFRDEEERLLQSILSLCKHVCKEWNIQVGK